MGRETSRPPSCGPIKDGDAAQWDKRREASGTGVLHYLIVPQAAVAQSHINFTPTIKLN